MTSKILIAALTALVRRVQKLPTALAHRDQLRRLAECEDRLLADVGLAREDINAALSAPWWRDPSAELVRRLGELKADPRCRTRGKTVRENGQPVVTSGELILAACNRRRLPVAPLYLAGR